MLVGVLNIQRRPFLTTGGRDLAALGAAVAGFMIVGPVELFLPHSVARHFGPYVWLLLGALYMLCVTLLVLMSRPRLVIYNMTAEQLRPLLADLAARLDAEHRWAGDSLALPQFGVQLQIEKFLPMRNVSLVATAAEQDFAGWRQLERDLDRELEQIETAANPMGVSMITLSLLLFAIVMFWMIRSPVRLQQGFWDLFQLAM